MSRANVSVEQKKIAIAMKDAHTSSCLLLPMEPPIAVLHGVKAVLTQTGSRPIENTLFH